MSTAPLFLFKRRFWLLLPLVTLSAIVPVKYVALDVVSSAATHLIYSVLLSLPRPIFYMYHNYHPSF
jgi:hypothetical protein